MGGKKEEEGEDIVYYTSSKRQDALVLGQLGKNGGRATKGSGNRDTRLTRLNDGILWSDLQIPARSIPLIVVQLPPPLDQISPRSSVFGDPETSTTGGMIGIPRNMITVLVPQSCNRHLHQLGLVRVANGRGRRHVDEHSTIPLILDGMVLGRPPDTDLVSGLYGGHGTESASVSARDGVLAGFVGTRFVTVELVRARDEVVRVLLVVSVGGCGVEAAEADARVDGVLARPSVTFAVLVRPPYVLVVVCFTGGEGRGKKMNTNGRTVRLISWIVSKSLPLFVVVQQHD